MRRPLSIQKDEQRRLATIGIEKTRHRCFDDPGYRALYVVNTVQVCGASVISDCAQGMLSDSDDHITLLEKSVEDRVAKELSPP